MKTQKMSLANIQGKMSRVEMKNIMAGSGFGCSQDGDVCGDVNGTTYSCCQTDRHLKCVNGYCE